MLGNTVWQPFQTGAAFIDFASSSSAKRTEKRLNRPDLMETLVIESQLPLDERDGAPRA